MPQKLEEMIQSNPDLGFLIGLFFIAIGFVFVLIMEWWTDRATNSKRKR